MIGKELPNHKEFKIGDATYEFKGVERTDEQKGQSRTVSYRYELSKEGLPPGVGERVSIELVVKQTGSEIYGNSPAEFELAAIFEQHAILMPELVKLVNDAWKNIPEQLRSGFNIITGPAPLKGYRIAFAGLSAHALLPAEKEFREKMIGVAQELDRVEQPITPVVELIRHAHKMAEETAT